jgi:hypothetical protein
MTKASCQIVTRGPDADQVVDDRAENYVHVDDEDLSAGALVLGDLYGRAG